MFSSSIINYLTGLIRKKNDNAYSEMHLFICSPGLLGVDFKMCEKNTILTGIVQNNETKYEGLVKG